MANSSYVIIDTETQEERHIRLIDNGDGTHSISTSGEGGSSASSSVGGGNGVYSNIQGDFTAIDNNGAKTITFSAYASAVLSAVLASINFLNAVTKRRTSAGVVDTLPLTNVSFASNILTLSEMTANFAVGDTVAVLVQGPDRGPDETQDAWKTTMATLLAGEELVNNVMKTVQQFGYATIATATTTTVKTGAGFIHCITVTGGTTGTIWTATSPCLVSVTCKLRPNVIATDAYPKHSWATREWTSSDSMIVGAVCLSPLPTVSYSPISQLSLVERKPSSRSAYVGRTTKVSRFAQESVRQWYDPYVYFERDDRVDDEGKGCHRRTPGIAGIGSRNPPSVNPSKPVFPLSLPFHQMPRQPRPSLPRQFGRRNDAVRSQQRGNRRSGNRSLPGCIGKPSMPRG